MATPNVGILTNAGKDLIDRVNAGQAKITFTKIVFSSMDNSQLTDDKIRALTTVAPQEVVVNNPEVTLDNSTGETRIRATGTNEKLDDGVYVKTYGVFAKDDTGNEILYGLTVSPNPNYFPAYDGVTPQVVTYSYKVIISNTSNITFTNSNDIYLSETDLGESLKPYAKIVYVNQQLDNKVTDNHDGTEQLNGVRVQPFNKLSDTIGGRNLLINSASDIVITSTSNNWNYATIKGDFVRGKVYTISAEITLTGSSNNLVSIWVNGPDIATNIVNTGSFLADGNRHSWTFACPENSNIFGIMIYAGVIGNTAGIGAIVHHVKIEQGSVPTDWSPAPEDKADDSKVVHSTDMRKPASDVAGIEEVNAKQDKIGYTPADDSKVVHNSGNEEIAGQKTFDAAPIDKTTGNPYITKDGVPSLPSDIARTGQSQTFTAAQTFSSAPTVQDTSSPKGDNQVALMGDLKSVKESAWRQLNVNISENNYTCTGLILYREIDSSTLEVTGNVLPVTSSIVTENSPQLFPIFQLSDYSELSSTSLVLYVSGPEGGGSEIRVYFKGNTAYIKNIVEVSGNLNFIVTYSTEMTALEMGAPTVSFTK